MCRGRAHDGGKICGFPDFTMALTGWRTGAACWLTGLPKCGFGGVAA